MAKTDTQIGIRVTSEFKEALEKQAEKERRTVANLIYNVMSDYLEMVNQPIKTDNSDTN